MTIPVSVSLIFVPDLTFVWMLSMSSLRVPSLVSLLTPHTYSIPRLVTLLALHLLLTLHLLSYECCCGSFQLTQPLSLNVT